MTTKHDLYVQVEINDSEAGGYFKDADNYTEMAIQQGIDAQDIRQITAADNPFLHIIRALYDDEPVVAAKYLYAMLEDVAVAVESTQPTRGTSNPPVEWNAVDKHLTDAMFALADILHAAGLNPDKLVFGEPVVQSDELTPKHYFRKTDLKVVQ